MQKKNKIDVELGSIFKKKRVELGISRLAMSKFMGFSDVMVWRHEIGDVRFSIEKIVQFCGILGIYLIELDGLTIILGDRK